MFWLRNKKNNFQLHPLIWGPGLRYIDCLQVVLAANGITDFPTTLSDFLIKCQTDPILFLFLCNLISFLQERLATNTTQRKLMSSTLVMLNTFYILNSSSIFILLSGSISVVSMHFQSEWKTVWILNSQLIWIYSAFING